jgi:hypothetical protein
MMECTNPGLFSAGPDWLEPGEERRQEALWQVARGLAAGEGGVLRRHVEECRACSRMVESFSRLDRGLRKGAPVFAACPGAKELSDYHYFELPVERREKVQQHLPECSSCREDLEWLARTAESNVITMPGRRFVIFGAIAAAVAALTVPLLRHHPDSRYAGLAQIPPVDRADLLRTLSQPDKFRSALEDSVNAYEAGDYADAEAKVQSILKAFPSDPSALYMKAMVEYRQGDLDQAAALMDASERAQPMSAFRCWSALQMGLATGNRARIDRECRHLAGHAQYADKVRQIQGTLRQRGA